MKHDYSVMKSWKMVYIKKIKIKLCEKKSESQLTRQV